MTAVEKAVKEISVLASQGKSIDLDNIVKKWKLDNGYHVQELNLLKTQVRQLQSQIFLNNANTFLAYQTAKTQQFTQDNLFANTQYINAQRNGYNSMLPLQRGLIQSQIEGNKLNNYYNHSVFPSRIQLENFNNKTGGWLTPQSLMPIFGGLLK